MFWKFWRKPKLGVLGPDPEDIRDYQLAEVQPEAVELPENFDLREKMTSIQNQHWGTCTANSVDAVCEFLDSQEYGREIKLSQKFIYINTKIISGLWTIQGDYIRNACKAVVKYGVCLEETFPDIKRSSWEHYIKDRPSPEAYKEALKFRKKTFWAVNSDLESIRQAIFQQNAPVTIGSPWYQSYFKTDNDGRLPLPSGKMVGGHAYDVVGWENGKLWFRNSWGPRYGKDGYFYIPFEEFSKYTFWNVRIILDMEAPQPKETIGWVADAWLRSEFTKGEIAWPTYRLNLRVYPWGRIIKTLNPGEKVKILGETQKTGNLTWQKVRLVKEERT
ncbi:MAG: C1 family peptidase [Candidatus Hodarchaeales archaeon]